MEGKRKLENVSSRPPKKQALVINTAVSTHSDSPESSPDSLFDESPTSDLITAAHRLPPPIPGLFFDPSLLIPEPLASSVFDFCKKTYFSNPKANQVMLFGRVLDDKTASVSGLPAPLIALLETIATLLLDQIPPDIHDLLFAVDTTPPRARQAIINLYNPGEGISPHVDLLGRYGDGIVGVSLHSTCVMRFESAVGQIHDLFLPERSVIVFSGDARYKWTHGIEQKKRDYVSGNEDSWIERGIRLSVTYRWLLPNANVLRS